MVLNSDNALKLITKRYQDRPKAQAFDQMLAGNGLSWRSRLNYSKALPALFEIGKPYEDLTDQDIIDLGAKIQERYSESTPS